MKDLLAALGLALVIEGLAYAAFPDAMRRMVEQITRMPPSGLRMVGLMTAGVGLIGVWLARKIL